MSYSTPWICGLTELGIRFSPAELSAMRLDGELYSVAEFSLLSDQPLSSSLKLHSVCHSEPDRIVASGASALWIHGLAPEPIRHEVTFYGHTRPGHLTESIRDIRELTLRAKDLSVCACTSHTKLEEQPCPHGRVLSPERAIADIARGDDRDDESVASDVADLIALGGFSVSAITKIVEDARRTPHRRRGLQRIRLVSQAQQSDVDQGCAEEGPS